MQGSGWARLPKLRLRELFSDVLLWTTGHNACAKNLVSKPDMDPTKSWMDSSYVQKPDPRIIMGRAQVPLK